MSRKYIFCVVKRHGTQVKSRNAPKFLRFIQNNKRKTVFVNIRGKREGLQTNLVNLLDYLSTNQPTDEYTHKLQHRVLEMRDDTEWRENYMTWEMKLDERYEAGRKEELCRQIKKKLEKGKNIAQIADECEETEESRNRMQMAIQQTRIIGEITTVSASI